MAGLLNLVKVAISTTGTGGPLTIGAAAPGRLDFDEAQAVDGATYSYALHDGLNTEMAYGVYDETGGTITRVTIISTDGVATPINLSGTAQLLITPSAEDFKNLTNLSPTDGGFVVGDGTKLVVETGGTALTSLGITAAGQAILDDATSGDILTTLGISAFAQTLLDDTTAADFRTTLDLEIGVDVQAYDGDLAAISAISDTGVVRRTGTNTWTAGTAVTTNEIANSAVTYAKIQDVSATDRILGRSSAGAGVVQEITCTAAGRALLAGATASDQLTTLGVSAFMESALAADGLPNFLGATLRFTMSVVADDAAAFLNLSDIGGGSIMFGCHCLWWTSSAGFSGSFNARIGGASNLAMQMIAQSSNNSGATYNTGNPPGGTSGNDGTINIWAANNDRIYWVNRSGAGRTIYAIIFRA